MKLEILEYLPEKQTDLPPLLFVHGGSHGAWCWKEHFLPYFSSNGFPSYAPSFRGHGESEGREKLESYSLMDYVDDVLQVMQQLSRKPVLIGHSLGGAIVQKLWQLHPDELEAVVLVASSSPSGMTKEWMKVFLTHFRPVYQLHMFNTGKREEFPERVRDMFFSLELPLEKRNEYVRLLQRESVKAGQEMIRQNIDLKSMNTNIPILVLGSKKDRFFSEKIAMNIARAYNTTPVIFPDLCHDMMLDPNWHTVADTILRFLHESVS